MVEFLFEKKIHQTQLLILKNVLKKNNINNYNIYTLILYL